MATKEATKTWGDKLDDNLREAESEKQRSRIVIHAKDLAWEDDKMVRSALVVSEMTGFGLKTLHSWLGEIHPGGRTGKHRHTSEAIMLCLGGEGYSVIDGTRYDWNEGDAVVMPAMTWHQHFNASDTKPFRFYAATNYPLTVNIGLAMIETVEYGSHHQEE